MIRVIQKLYYYHCTYKENKGTEMTGKRIEDF